MLPAFSRTGRLAAAAGRPPGELRSVERATRLVIGDDDEGQHLGDRHMQAVEVGGADAAHPARQQQAAHRLDAEPRHAQQQLLRRPVQVDRELLAVRQRPAQLGVDLERQHAVGVAHDLVVAEAVEAHQPIGLVERCSRTNGGARNGRARAASGIGLKAE